MSFPAGDLHLYNLEKIMILRHVCLVLCLLIYVNVVSDTAYGCALRYKYSLEL